MDLNNSDSGKNSKSDEDEKNVVKDSDNKVDQKKPRKIMKTNELYYYSNNY